MHRRRLYAAAYAVGIAIFPAVSSAQDASSFDLTRGALNGSTRRIGLGGAFVALADDTDGVAINPASVAVRLPYSWRWWDYGVGADFAIGARLPGNDLYKQGQRRSSALFASLAAIMYAGHFGVGVAAEAQSNAAGVQREQDVVRDLAGSFGIVHTDAGHGFWDGQLVVGVGLRFIGMRFDREASHGVVGTAGAGYEAGLTLKPTNAKFRFAASYRSPIDATWDDNRGQAHVPWDLALGFAYQFGPRNFNPRFVSTRDLARQRAGGGEPTPADWRWAAQQRWEEWQRRQRRYLLLSAELALVETDGARKGAERLWLKDGYVSPSDPAVIPRIGAESEVVPHVLRLRAGSYYEPEHVGYTRPKLHGTAGLDVRTFRFSLLGLNDPFTWWQVSLAADVARSYLNTSVSLGWWH
jgi:hypothetical protein